jgi:hypothetical protein
MNREQIIQMAREAGFERLGHTDEDWVCYPEDIEAFAKLVAEHEREACAKLCEDLKITGLMLDAYSCNDAKYKCAEAIRARGQA